MTKLAKKIRYAIDVPAVTSALLVLYAVAVIVNVASGTSVTL